MFKTKERVLKLYKSGFYTIKEISEIVGITAKEVYQIIKQEED